DITPLGDEHPVIRAMRDDAVLLLRGLYRPIVFETKALFALLTDPAYERVLGADVAREVARYVPWTRLVADTTTSYEGRSVDLLSFAAEHRAELVLKPTAMRAAAGVLLGSGASSDQWSAALRKALSEPHIVQRRVASVVDVFPMLDAESVSL